jgi:hypothetical protein
MVSNQKGISPIWQFDKPQGMGLCSGDPRCVAPHVKRLFFQFSRGDAKNKHVLTATFKAHETWSWKCTPSVVDLHLVNKKIKSTLTWGTRPRSVKRLASRNVSAGRGDICPQAQPPRDVEFRSAKLTKAVRQLAAGTRAQLTVMLKARNEKSSNGWKRFSKDALLRVIYANKPLVPDQTGVKGESAAKAKCATAADVAKGKVVTLATTRPWLVARMKASPAAGSKTRAVFEVQKKPQGGEWQKNTWSGQYPGKASDWETAGVKALVRPGKADAFQDQSAMFRMRAHTVSRWSYELSNVTSAGELASKTSPWCYFRISVEAPHAPSVVSGGPYVTCTDDGCVAAGGPGVAATFTFSAFTGAPATADDAEVAANTADLTVTKFTYQLMSPGFSGPEITVPATTNSGKLQASATASVAPVSGGRAQLTVRSCDGAGCGEPQVFDFAVAIPSGPVGLWHFADAVGAKTAVDSQGETSTPRPLTLRGGSASGTAVVDPRGRRGNVTGDQALGLGTAGMYADTNGPVTPAGGSFTVSAWAYRTSTTTATVVSQASNDTTSTGWDLYYSSAYDAWVFNWHWNDAAGTTQYVRSKGADGSVTPLGTWTHLAGVFDASDSSAPTIQLFVNGRAQGEPQSVAGANRVVSAAGNLQVGRVSLAKGEFKDYLTGLVDEVSVWARALSPAEVGVDSAALVSGTNVATALVGDWDFTEAAPSTGTAAQVADSSLYARGPMTGHGAQIQTVAAVDPGVPEEEDPFADVQFVEDVNLADETAGQDEAEQDADDGVDELTSADALNTQEQALVLDGRAGYADTSGPVVDETASFTVSATVRLDTTALAGKSAGYRAQLAGQRAGQEEAESSWSLWWELTEVKDGVPWGCWHLSRTSSTALPEGTCQVDGSGSADESVPDGFQDEPEPAGPVVEVSGAYDALSGQISVYVDAEAGQAGMFEELRAGAGELSVGRARRGGQWTDFLPARVSRVRIWSGAMSDAQINTQVLG